MKIKDTTTEMEENPISVAIAHIIITQIKIKVFARCKILTPKLNY